MKVVFTNYNYPFNAILWFQCYTIFIWCVMCSIITVSVSSVLHSVTQDNGFRSSQLGMGEWEMMGAHSRHFQVPSIVTSNTRGFCLRGSSWNPESDAHNMRWSRGIPLYKGTHCIVPYHDITHIFFFSLLCFRSNVPPIDQSSLWTSFIVKSNN